MTTIRVKQRPATGRGTATAISAAQPIEPLAVGIQDACRVTGISRSELYRRLATKQVSVIKSGTRTLILVDSLRRHLASLPPATFRDQTAEE